MGEDHNEVADNSRRSGRSEHLSAFAPMHPAGQAPLMGDASHAVLHELLREQRAAKRRLESASASDDDGHRTIADKLLGRAHGHRRREVARTFRIPYVTARRIWQALALPTLGAAGTPFTDADLDAMPVVADLRRAAGMDDELVLDLIRALSRTTNRLVAWQTGLVAKGVVDRRCGTHDDSAAPRLDAHERRQVVDEMLTLSSTLESALIYSWRRHLAASLDHLLADLDDLDEDDDTGDVLTVGFADLVGFTSAVTGMSDRALASLVGEFEELASDVVDVHGGRVVKTLGDEVLFICERPAGAAAIGLDLIEALRSEPDMPALRVGIATGTVLRHSGDVFGTTVNRASRLTTTAEPGTVVVDTATQTALSEVYGFELRRLEATPLAGLGLTLLWELHRTSVPHRRGSADYRRPE